MKDIFSLIFLGSKCNKVAMCEKEVREQVSSQNKIYFSKYVHKGLKLKETNCKEMHSQSHSSTIILGTCFP